ncbi:TIGR01777 family oxidoreductase [Telmatobacter sp. DSM 110680]|uniref:TIGR01777 family oxidoreductase n=1 Tax=Telmatobacter sp. DSM 110680 TaxID=3036704 RepID=A0AAU7DHS8_9BACT
MDFSMDSGGVILSGASGMLGNALTLALNNRKTPVLQLVRRHPSGERQLQWSPEVDPAVNNPAPLEGAAAAIHLSGASVAAHRWTNAYKEELATSRLDSTRRLAKVLAELRRPPQTLLVASAIGIYGDRGDEVLSESSPAGSGFLAELCQRWEAAAEPAIQAGIRVVHLRFGVVLGPGKGALQQMLPPFRVGLGARLGSGKQWMSWVALADVVAATLFALDHPELSGALNVVSPNPVTNADFTRSLGRELRRPAFLAVPAFALRIMFGQMADEALLASARVQPAKLQAAGFQFSLPEVGGALKAALR